MPLRGRNGDHPRRFQTLASDVEMTRCGDCVQCITLLLHKATAPLKKQ